MNGTCNGTIYWVSGPLGPWGGAKRSNIINSQLLRFQRFKPNFVCLVTNERYKTYQTEFSFHRLGYAPGVGLGGIVGGWAGVDNFFSEIQP